MASYFMNEGVFDLPDLGFVDKTIHLFGAPSPSGREIGLIVCRAKMAPGKTLEEVVKTHVDHEAKNMRAFSVLGQRTVEWHGNHGIEISSRYRNRDEMAFQKQFHTSMFGQWLLFGANSHVSERETAEACLEHVLSSFQPRNM